MMGYQNTDTVKYETQGFSPKVYIPVALQILGGIVLILSGLDIEGKTAIATGIATLISGFAAGPGKVLAKQR